MSEKNLTDEVKELQSRLETLEHGEFGKRIAGLRKANRQLALKLSVLQLVAALLFMLLSILAVSYFNQLAVQEVLIDTFQNKLGDTIDRTSLLAPGNEDKDMVKELSDMRDQLSRICASSGRCAALSKLTDALKLIVNEGKAQDASDQINRDMLQRSQYRFVASRAGLLQATARFHPDGLCHEPGPTLELLGEAIKKDSGVVAALNLEGVCLAQRSAELMKNGKSAESIQNIHAARRDNELAFQFKPSRWSKVRFFNNKVWEYMQFLLYAMRLNEEDFKKALAELREYENMEDFFEKSLKDIEECYSLSQDQATYLETEAELHALEYTYYTSIKDVEKAKAAKEKMLDKLTEAINNDLLRLRKLSSLEGADAYFKKDVLLLPLFNDYEKGPLNDQIKTLIKDRLAQPQ